MNHFIIHYIEAQILVGVLYGVLRLTEYFAHRRLLPWRSVSLLGRWALAFALLYPLLATWLPSSNFAPAAQLWSAADMKAAAHPKPVRVVQIAASEAFPVNSQAGNVLFEGLVLLLLVGWSGFFLSLLWGLWKLHRLADSSQVVRRCGSLKLGFSSKLSTAVAFSLFGKSYVLVPDSLAHSRWMRVLLSHELTHLRHQDTLSVYLLEVFSRFFWINPIAKTVALRLSAIEEFACDEALIGHKVSPQAYGRCLLEAAQTCLADRQHRVGTTGLLSGGTGHSLLRRVIMLDKYQRKIEGRWKTLIVMGVVTLMAGTAFAARGVVKDRRVSLRDAREMGKNVQSDFPITVNESVVTQLNRFLGTPEGRKRIREGLARLENHRELVEAALEQYQLPKELMAIALIESGYQNLPSSVNPVGGAGVWQFIASTARRYNLIVEDHLDQRLNIPLETDAAMRLLGALYLRFQDWQLAVLGYNAGEGKVQRGIFATGSRDPWELIEQGYSGDEDYLAMIMAGILIMNNPKVIQ